MADFDLLIRNGKVVHDNTVIAASIGIANGKILAVDQDLVGSAKSTPPISTSSPASSTSTYTSTTLAAPTGKASPPAPPPSPPAVERSSSTCL
jgi:hypothetical protein